MSKWTENQKEAFRAHRRAAHVVATELVAVAEAYTRAVAKVARVAGQPPESCDDGMYEAPEVQEITRAMNALSGAFHAILPLPTIPHLGEPRSPAPPSGKPAVSDPNASAAAPLGGTTPTNQEEPTDAR